MCSFHLKIKLGLHIQMSIETTHIIVNKTYQCLHSERILYSPPFLNPATWSAGHPEVMVIYGFSLCLPPVHCT